MTERVTPGRRNGPTRPNVYASRPIMVTGGMQMGDTQAVAMARKRAEEALLHLTADWYDMAECQDLA